MEFYTAIASDCSGITERLLWDSEIPKRISIGIRGTALPMIDYDFTEYIFKVNGHLKIGN